MQRPIRTEDVWTVQDRDVIQLVRLRFLRTSYTRAAPTPTLIEVKLTDAELRLTVAASRYHFRGS